MNAVAFYFISILMRFMVVGLGVLGISVFWKLLSDLLWPSSQHLETIIRFQEAMDQGFPATRALLVAAYCTGLLLSMLILGAGLWLIYKRLRGGLDSARYVAPENPAVRWTSMVAFGLFGLFFSLVAFGHLKATATALYTASIASSGEAVVVEKRRGHYPDRSIEGHYLDTLIALPEGGKRQEEIKVPIDTFQGTEIGDEIPVYYWPSGSGETFAQASFTTGRVGFFLLKTLIFVALALVGLSGFWACLRGRENPTKPVKPRQSSTSKSFSAANGGKAQFGKRL